ncbi:MAG: hypothetical protein ACTSUN_00440 [Promethearchaeota archaeon]
MREKAKYCPLCGAEQ